MSAANQYFPDFTTTYTLATAASDATVQIPQDKLDAINNPRSTGSLWFVCVDGNPVAVNIGAVGACAVFPATTGANNAILEVGNNLTEPVWLPPGKYFHAICAGGKTAIVSLIRARRAS